MGRFEIQGARRRKLTGPDGGTDDEMRRWEMDRMRWWRGCGGLAGYPNSRAL